MLGISDLPADLHRGRWHIELKTSKPFAAGARFINGRTAMPVPGRVARSVVAVIGREVSRFYRVDSLGAALAGDGACLVGEPFEAAPAEAPPVEEPASEPSPVDESQSIHDMDKGALVEFAESYGVEIDKRWGRDRILAAIEEAGGQPE